MLLFPTIASRFRALMGGCEILTAPETAIAESGLSGLATRIAETVVDDLHLAHHHGGLEVWDYLHAAPKGDLPADLHITTHGQSVIRLAVLHELEQIFGRRA